jgi:hypothetical protein
MTFPSPTWTAVAADDLSQPWHRDAALSLGLVVPNAYNTLHGGAVAAIAEAIGMACARAAAGDNEMFLGELSTAYLSAARLDVRSASLSILPKSGLSCFLTLSLLIPLHHCTASTAPSWISRCLQRLLLRQPRLRWPSARAMKRGHCSSLHVRRHHCHKERQASDATRLRRAAAHRSRRCRRSPQASSRGRWPDLHCCDTPQLRHAANNLSNLLLMPVTCFEEMISL